MRITRNSDTKSSGKKIKIKSQSSTDINFKETLAQIKQQEIREKLDELIEIIEKQGNKLKSSLDKKDLSFYKEKVKDFLQLIQKEFGQAKQSFSWDNKGNLKTFTIIEKIDQNLDILQQLFVKEQADTLKVLQKIDQIRGLLLDLLI